MLRWFAVATVAMMLMGAIGVAVGDTGITSYFTGLRTLPHVVSTIFYGLSGR